MSELGQNSGEILGPQALRAYEEENWHINWTTLPIEKDYPPRRSVPDGTTWEDPVIADYERERDANHSYLSRRVEDDFAAGKYGTHPEEVTPEMAETFKAKGYRLDSLSRPLLPYMPAGIARRGGLWHFGGRGTADIVITRQLSDIAEAIFIHKAGKAKAATPGGFINIEEGESQINAAIREAFEETHVDVESAAIAQELGTIICRSSRTTDHAWLETTGFHFHLSGGSELQLPEGGDDAKEAAWMPITDTSVEGMSAHHLALVRASVEIGSLAVELS